MFLLQVSFHHHHHKPVVGQLDPHRRFTFTPESIISMGERRRSKQDIVILLSLLFNAGRMIVSGKCYHHVRHLIESIHIVVVVCHGEYRLTRRGLPLLDTTR